MKTLLKNGNVVNVFTDTVERADVLIEDDVIIGVGDYSDSDAENVCDVSGKYISPGFIDGHIHIESTMLTPVELAKVCLPHGTTGIVADPHEIANVCGTDGIKYMLQMSENIPLNVHFMLPSCVPSTAFDESGAILNAEELKEFYDHKRVLGLAEMMNYPGVLCEDENVLKKIEGAKKAGAVIDGHAPLLTGKDLDKYISAGIQSDHECSSLKEGMERIRKGQWVMIRQGTAAKNLPDLIDLFDEPYNRRCLLVTDDKHPADLINEGHIDSIIRQAVKAGKSINAAIRMASIQAAQCFGMKYKGAVAPGYKADLLIINDLENVEIEDVYCDGKLVVKNKTAIEIKNPVVDDELKKKVCNSFCMKETLPSDFYIEEKSDKCRVIEVVPKQLLTNELITQINFSVNNGIDLHRDILKLAVIERHKKTGHIGKGFITGIGLKEGAIASSVSHDSHNLIVIGTNDADMSVATNYIRSIGGGNVIVKDGKVIASMPLPIGGLMSDVPALELSLLNKNVRDMVYTLGVKTDIEPFMNMAFVSLSVIPSLKMTTRGLVDVNKQQPVSLYVMDKKGE